MRPGWIPTPGPCSSLWIARGESLCGRDNICDKDEGNR